MEENKSKTKEQTLPDANVPKSQPTDTVGKSEFDGLKNIIYAFLVVVAIAVVGLIIQFLINSAVSFQNLNEQVSAQNSKIDTLIQINTQILLNAKGK